jgi:hypothetical protein
MRTSEGLKPDAEDGRNGLGKRRVLYSPEEFVHRLHYSSDQDFNLDISTIALTIESSTGLPG